MKNSSRFLFLLTALALAVFCCVSAFAQEMATLNGRITDPNGLPVPGVKVQAVNVNTNIVYSSETNEVGLYTIPSLPPGTYRVTVEKQGFVQIVKPDVELHVLDIVALNFALQIGSVTQSVTVKGGAPLVNTQDAAVSTVINRDFVSQLPLNGRSFNTLLQLTPGVVIAPPQGLAGSQYSVGGQRTDSNNFLVDGVSANFGTGIGAGVGQAGTGNSQAFSALGGTSSLISVEALQEFRVETSSFAPEFGRAPGGQVILNTRSGTNTFHGGIYEYFRNDVLDANDWFAKQVGNPRAPERHNDFGGFLGGPIWKDKTFFFLSYEGARLRVPQTQVIRVPSEYARSSAPTAIAPYLNAFPQPDNRTITTGVYTAPFTGSYSNTATLNAGSIRIDHTFNERFSVFGRYNDAPSDFTPRIIGSAILNPTTVDTRTVTLGMNMLLSTRVFNAIRGNYSTQSGALSTALDSLGGAVPPPSALLLGSLSTADNSGVFQTNDTTAIQTGVSGRNRTRQLNFIDDVSINSGAHQLKFGGDYRAIFLDRNPGGYQVIARSSSVQTFVTTGTVQLTVSLNRPSQVLAQSFSLYGQDTWKLTPRLAVTYGARWELAPAPSARGNTTLPAWMNVNDPAQIALAPAGTPLWNTTHGNFAPRVGVAYRLNPNGSFVLRVGGDIFYNVGTGDFADSIVYFPNRAQARFQNVSLPIGDITPFLPAAPSLQPPYKDIIFAYSPNLSLPRSYQWNAALERALGGSQVITLTYLGQAGRDLTRQEALFQPNPNIQNEFLLTKNSAWSNYHALQVQYRRPLAARVQAILNYTWSHSLDNASNDVVAGLSNTVISAASDYASSDFDVRHSFSAAMTYQIPGITRYRPLSLVSRD